jgi:hypothetical protein
VEAAGVIGGVFLVFYFLPVGVPRLDGAVHEALALTKWYAQEHVLLCLIPAFFIAGAISVFVNQGPVLRYLGPTFAPLLAFGLVRWIGMSALEIGAVTVLTAVLSFAFPPRALDPVRVRSGGTLSQRQYLRRRGRRLVLRLLGLRQAYLPAPLRRDPRGGAPSGAPRRWPRSWPWVC